MLIPAPQPALTDPQLDGALRQMRTYLAQMAAGGGGYPPGLSGDVLEELLSALPPDGQPGPAPPAGPARTRDFHPAAMDLAALCRKVVDGCAGLLGAEGVVLTYHSALSSLLIPGDSGLLEHVLLELIANGARWTGRGH